MLRSFFGDTNFYYTVTACIGIQKWIKRICEWKKLWARLRINRSGWEQYYRNGRWCVPGYAGSPQRLDQHLAGITPFSNVPHDCVWIFSPSDPPHPRSAPPDPVILAVARHAIGPKTWVWLREYLLCQAADLPLMQSGELNQAGRANGPVLIDRREARDKLLLVIVIIPHSWTKQTHRFWKWVNSSQNKSILRSIVPSNSPSTSWERSLLTQSSIIIRTGPLPTILTLASSTISGRIEHTKANHAKSWSILGVLLAMASRIGVKIPFDSSVTSVPHSSSTSYTSKSSSSTVNAALACSSSSSSSSHSDPES